MALPLARDDSATLWVTLSCWLWADLSQGHTMRAQGLGRWVSPGGTHSGGKSTLWKSAAKHRGRVLDWVFFSFLCVDSLLPRASTFYKCYSMARDFWDYVDQDKSTSGDTSLNKMRWSSCLSPLQRRKQHNSNRLVISRRPLLQCVKSVTTSLLPFFFLLDIHSPKGTTS